MKSEITISMKFPFLCQSIISFNMKMVLSKKQKTPHKQHLDRHATELKTELVKFRLANQPFCKSQDGKVILLHQDKLLKRI